MASKQKYAMPLDDEVDEDDYQYNQEEEIDDENFSDEDDQHHYHNNDEEGVEDIEETDNQYEEPQLTKTASERAAAQKQQPKNY